jgi:CRISPR type III-associated protein (TIGR04423 family)
MKWIESNEKVIEYLNSLEGFEGFVRYSHRPIKSGDIFRGEVKIKKEDGFIVEAFFCNGKKSIEIKQINNKWLLGEFDLPDKIDNKDLDIFESRVAGRVKMLQLWEEEEVDGFLVKKLKNVVFFGFEGE